MNLTDSYCNEIQKVFYKTWGKKKVSSKRAEGSQEHTSTTFLVAPTQSGDKCRHNFSKTSQANFYQHNFHSETLHLDFSKVFIFSLSLQVLKRKFRLNWVGVHSQIWPRLSMAQLANWRYASHGRPKEDCPTTRILKTHTSIKSFMKLLENMGDTKVGKS